MKKHYFEDEIYNFDSERDSITENIKETRSIKKERFPIGKVRKRVISISLIILIAYVIFLIIGALSTEYYYDDNGNRKIVKGSISVLEDRDDYESLANYVDQLRDMMVDITIIDIKLANENLSYGQASIQYSEILKNADLMIPKIETLDVKTRNALIKQNIQIIVSNDIALYLQFMINGLEKQDSASINDASLWKKSMMQTYSAINEEMLDLANRIHREDDDFFSWELEEEVSRKDKSAVLKERDESE